MARAKRKYHSIVVGLLRARLQFGMLKSDVVFDKTSTLIKARKGFKRLLKDRGMKPSASTGTLPGTLIRQRRVDRSFDRSPKFRPLLVQVSIEQRVGLGDSLCECLGRF